MIQVIISVNGKEINMAAEGDGSQQELYVLIGVLESLKAKILENINENMDSIFVAKRRDKNGKSSTDV
jgi:hypothetical protein